MSSPHATAPNDGPPGDRERGAWAWLRAVEPDLDRLDGAGMVFIVGPPRSGTTWLQRLLATHPRVRTGQESFVFAWYLERAFQRWRREVERQEERSANRRQGIGLGAFLREEDVLRWMRLPLAQMLSAAGVQENDLFLEKTPGHARTLPAIREVLPKARVIAVIRDPRDVVASLLAASTSWGRDWAPRGGRAAAAEWTANVQGIRQGRTLLGPRELFEVRYEALRERPERVLRQVAEFLEVAWTDAEIVDAVRRNAPAAAVQGEATPIPLFGAYADLFGEAAQEPGGFVGPARNGARRASVPLLQRIMAWRSARWLAAQEGYPSDLASWIRARR